jgi:hypothetical protein
LSTESSEDSGSATRESAKGAVVQKTTADPELAEVLSGAHKLQLDLTKEANRHALAMHKSELGFIGRALGGPANAPVVVACIALLCGVAVYVGCLYAASQFADQADFWGKQGERVLAFAGAALAFIFGRGSK